MANRTGGRSATRTKTTGSKAKGRAKQAATQAEPTPQPQNNREIVYQKLEEQTAPILEKYGVPAFDELLNRLESTIKEFNEEVGSLFTEMVDQSREEHERMKSLLSEEGCEGGEQEEKLENVENMSEFEKKLERIEKVKASEASATEGK